MRIAIRKYSYLFLACCLMSCSAHSWSDKYKTFKQNIIYNIANYFGEVAYTHYSSNNYLEAINYCEHKIELLEILIEEQNDTCTSTHLTNYLSALNDLGYLYSLNNDYIHAEKYYLEVLKIRKSTYGTKNPDYATALSNLGLLYAQNGNLTNAEKYYLEALEIRKEFHDDCTLLLGILGTLYSEMADFQKAEQCYTEALEIRKTSLGVNHPDYAISLSNLGTLYSKVGDSQKAEKYYLEALNIRKSVLGVNHLDYALSLNNLGSYYLNMGDYAQAEKYYIEALEIRKSSLEVNHLDYAISLNNLGTLYSKMGDFQKAEEYYVESLNIRKSVLGINHSDYAVSLHNLASHYHDIGNYKKAEKYYLEALEIRKSTIGINHPDYALSLNNLGAIYAENGNFTKAKECYLEAADIHYSIYGEFHLKYATSLNNLGSIYSDIGDYKQAEKYYLEALNIRKSVLGVNHPDYALSLNNLGSIYSDIGDYKQAEKYYLEALKIRKSVLGINHPDYALSLNNLGSYYLNVGDYAQAEKCYIEALEIRRLSLGVNHPDYAVSLHNLGTYYSDIGNYKKAETYYLEALEIRKASFGVNHPVYAISLSNLGTLYSEVGNSPKAEKYYLKALELYKSSIGTNNIEYAQLVDNVGGYYLSIKDYDKSKKFHNEALDIHKSIFGSNHPNYALSLNNLGVVYSYEKEYAIAEKYYLEALNIQKSVLGINHTHYVSSLDNVGKNYLEQGCPKKAFSYLALAFKIQKESFEASLNYMTEEERGAYWKTKQHRFNNLYPTFAYKYHFSKPSISTFAYDNELFRKGLLLPSSNIIRQSILESNDSILTEQWNELVGTKQVIMNLEEKEPTSTNLVHCKNQADSLEKIITKSSAIFRETKQQQSITWDSIQQYLTPDEVAIEYFIAPLNEDSTMYCALLLRHDSQYPELIPLCEEKEIVNCLSQNRTNDIYTFDTNSKTIFNLIWDKILPQIHEGETIYFSPAGLLHQIAIENIPYDQTHTMSDVYTMVRLSSTREIVKKDKSIKHHTATIYGGIFYDVDKTSLLAESRNYDTEDMFAYRSISSTLPNRGSVLYLPGTKKEAESIHSLLNSNNITSTLYTSSKANEESFKSLSGKHRNILHIGTHGFYWEDSTARKQDYFSQRIQLQMLGDNQLQKPSIDPLTRCGLLFAGSNIALSGHSNDLPEGVQDGILTAKEISLMDLRDADLVVLSACETAKGDITSEGIFGLQRAFKMAGVQTIIMSLWKVNDQATQMLMTEFYTNWISKNQSKREAFKNAQNTVRAKFEEPEYWAGFILLD